MNNEELELLSDSKYRQFISAVEKALKGFDYTSEWADLISALGKLNKVLMGHAKFPVIPRKLTIGKRLAQCMHPNLPSGVHLKALETYDLIFKRIGRKGLAQDLFTYSAGLFPLLGQAAMSVKPVLLGMYENYYVPLGKAMLPGLTGLVLGLLPGIEEGSEYTDRTISLLEAVCQCTEKQQFYGAVWECIETATGVRLPGTTFILSRLSKNKTTDGQQYILGNDLDLMVKAVCFCLGDTNVLVQRNGLDFILALLPMHTDLIHRRLKHQLTEAGLEVLLRRDMSLNRRLYTWILGSNGDAMKSTSRTDSVCSTDDQEEAEHQSYFSLHSRHLVTSAMKSLFQQQADWSSVQSSTGKKALRLKVLKPFRILLVLLDRPEIGSVILEDVLLEVFRALQVRCMNLRDQNKFSDETQRRDSIESVVSTTSNPNVGSFIGSPSINFSSPNKAPLVEELIKTTNVLFNAFEPYFMWEYIAQLIIDCGNRAEDTLSKSHAEKACDAPFTSYSEIFHLTDFILDNVSLEAEVETQTEHWPELLRKLTMEMTSRCKIMSLVEIREGIYLCSKLLSKVMPMTTEESRSRDTSFALAFEGSEFEELNEEVFKEHLVSSTEELDGAIKQGDEKGEMSSGDSVSLEERESLGDNSDDTGTEQRRKSETPSVNSGRKQGTPSGSVRRKSETPSSTSSEGSRDKNVKMDERVLRNLVAKGKKDGRVSEQEGQEWCIIQGKENMESDDDDDDDDDDWDDFQDSSEMENSVELDRDTQQQLADKDNQALQGSSAGEGEGSHLKPSQRLFQPFIKSCVKYFQAFFAEFVEHRVLNCENLLVSDDQGKDQNRTKSKHDVYTNTLISGKLLAARQRAGKSGTTGKNHKHLPATDSGIFLPLQNAEVSKECAAAVTAACKLLVELSCFPVYCDESTSELDEKVDPKGKEQIPDWLQSLVLCCLDIEDFAIQSCAIGTLLDLINLTLSVAPSGTGTRSRESTAVVVIPMISRALLAVIEQSDIYQLISEGLWTRLKESNTGCHQRIVELFLQLHYLTPNAVLCQNVITNSLVDEDKEVAMLGHWKFAVFWHIARNITVQDSGRCSNLGHARTLDNALFAMLDSLGSDEPEIRIVAQYWISHALQHGDLGRVLDPLLLLLLHPATTREAIHYFNQPRDTEKQPITAGQSVDKNERVITVKDRKPSASGSKVTDDSVQRNGSRDKLHRQNVSSTNTSRPRLPSGKSTSDWEVRRVTRSGSVQSSTSDDGKRTGQEHDPDREYDEHKKAGKQTSDNKPPRPRSLSSGRAHGHIHPLDQHKLLYLHVYDSQRTLYAFKCLMAIVRSAAHQFTCAISTTSVSSSNTPHQQRIKELLVRHRRALLGKGFYGPLYESPVSPAGSSTQGGRLFGGPWMYLRPNTSKYLEILISVCLYFIRSHYPSHLLIQPADNTGNLEVQISSAELLTCLVWQLVAVVNESGSAYGTFVSDLFSRCKVQKALLHCLVCTVYNRPGHYGHLVHSPSKPTHPSHPSQSCTHQISEPQSKVLQIKLLRLLQAILILEDCVQCTEPSNPDGSRPGLPLPPPPKQEEKVVSPQDHKTHSSSQRFLPDQRLSSQGMLLSVVLHGLKHDTYDLRHEWLRFVLACLPHMREDLHKWVTPVVEQICYSLREIAIVYRSDERRSERDSRVNLPPDYMVTLLDSLTSICQYCLTENTPSSPVLSLQPRSGGVLPSASSLAPAIGESGIQSGSNSVQIFTNLLHAFSVQSAPVSNVKDIERPNPVHDAREKLLSILPTILTSLISVWNTWQPETSASIGQRAPNGLSLNHIGAPKVVRQHILQLLTPVAMNHTIVLLASLADVWHQRRRRDRGDRRTKITPEVSDDQKVVVEIVYAIKALSFEDTIKTVKKILRQMVTSKEKPKGTGMTSQLNLEVSMLQFLYEYLKKASLSQLAHARTPLIGLIKEGLQLNLPPAIFLLLVILHSCVQRLPLHEDKKMRKELQDVTQKLIESCNTVAGSSLESAAWFRRSLAVIPQAPGATTEDDQSSSAVESEVLESEPATTTSAVASGSSNYSTQALIVLAELLAPLLDVMFGSEEKDRVTSLLTTVMYNVTPYLRNHSPHNVPSFRACCSLLASLSGYQYTRRAWKKDVMELLLDLGFFQMDITCMASWRAIMDNLMTQDNTSFKELMTRVAGSASQGTAINIFANREQEMEQRAQLLKKLSFTIFCSEPEQYQPCMPEIQERLAESLRLPQVPVLLEQVFLCFRVLLLRMSADHLISLWPVMMSELVHVLLQMENDLSCDGKSQSQRMVIAEALLGTNGCYMAYNQEKWLGLYLAACKLLDLALALPTDSLPQFQMYRWAFQGDSQNAQGCNGPAGIFKPHIVRLCKLLRKRCKRLDGDHDPEGLPQHTPGKLFLTMYNIKSIDQLLPFFVYLTKGRAASTSTTASGDEKDKRGRATQTLSGRTLIERVVERDFLDPLVAD